MYKWLKQVLRSDSEVSIPAQQDSPVIAEESDVQAAERRLKEAGDAHLNRGEYDRAEALYREAIAIQPEFADAHCHLGFVLRAQGKLDEAVPVLLTTVRLNPAQVDAHFMLGLIVHGKGEINAAVMHFRNAIQASPAFEPAYAELSNILREVGNFDELLSILISGVEENRESALLQYMLGQVYFDLKQIDKARLSFKTVLAHDPSHVQSWIGLANCAHHFRVFSETMRPLQIALEVDPEIPGLKEEFDTLQQEMEAYRRTSILIKSKKLNESKKVRLVCATRAPANEFMELASLGKSLTAHNALFDDFELQLFAENKKGLPIIYNEAIEYAKRDPAILVFIHDDLHLRDYFWIENIREAVQHFDIVGLAGNVRRVPGQVAWIFVNLDAPQEEILAGNLSGAVGDGVGRFGTRIVSYGPAKRECKLLDGLFLAADSETLINSGLRFDENFKFHFYDLDFCRQAELKNLRMGTWPISVIHDSRGAFATPSWWEGLHKYQEKYGEAASSLN